MLPGAVANTRDRGWFFWGLRLVMTHNPLGVDVWSSLQHGTK